MSDFSIGSISRRELELLVYDHMYSSCRTTIDWMPELDKSVLRGTDSGPYGYGNPEWPYEKPLWEFDADDPIFWDENEQINQLIFHFLSLYYPKQDIFETWDVHRQLKSKGFEDIFTVLFWKRLFRNYGKSSHARKPGIPSIKETTMSPVTRICWRAIARGFNGWITHHYREFIESSTLTQKSLERSSEEPDEIEAGFERLEIMADNLLVEMHPETGWESYCDEQVDLSREWLRWRGFPHTNEAVANLWQYTSFWSDKYKYPRRNFHNLYTHSGDMDIEH